MAETDCAGCRCSNIQIMLLFYDLKQRFPNVPDQMVFKVIHENFHDKTACETLLQRESNLYVQCYPGALISGDSPPPGPLGPILDHCTAGGAECGHPTRSQLLPRRTSDTGSHGTAHPSPLQQSGGDGAAPPALPTPQQQTDSDVSAPLPLSAAHARGARTPPRDRERSHAAPALPLFQHTPERDDASSTDENSDTARSTAAPCDGPPGASAPHRPLPRTLEEKLELVAKVPLGQLVREARERVTERAGSEHVQGCEVPKCSDVPGDAGESLPALPALPAPTEACDKSQRLSSPSSDKSSSQSSPSPSPASSKEGTPSRPVRKKLVVTSKSPSPPSELVKQPPVQYATPIRPTTLSCDISRPDRDRSFLQPPPLPLTSPPRGSPPNSKSQTPTNPSPSNLPALSRLSGTALPSPRSSPPSQVQPSSCRLPSPLTNAPSSRLSSPASNVTPTSRATPPATNTPPSSTITSPSSHLPPSPSRSTHSTNFSPSSNLPSPNLLAPPLFNHSYPHHPSAPSNDLSGGSPVRSQSPSPHGRPGHFQRTQQTEASKEYEVAVECVVCPSAPGDQQQSFTSVNLTLRPPSAETTVPIDITSGKSLTYTSASFDPRQGYKSHLQIRIGPAGGCVTACRTRVSSPIVRTASRPASRSPCRAGAVCQSRHHVRALLQQQRERKEVLARELRRGKDRLRAMQAQVQAMKITLARVSDTPYFLTKLRADIDTLRGECERLTAIVDSYTDQNSPGNLPLGAGWSCRVCTFRNHPLLSVCEECEMPRLSLGTGLAAPGNAPGLDHEQPPRVRALSNPVFSNNNTSCAVGETSTSVSRTITPLQER